MIQSVRKTLEIMEYIAQNGNNVRLLDIANALQLQTTTTYNFLKTLNELGYVEQQATSPRYRVTSKVNALLPPETSLTVLKKKLSPLLEKVMKATGETTYLSVQMGTFMRHELKCEPDRAVKISLELGKEFAIINTAIGKVFMAHSPHLQNTWVINLEQAQSEKLREKLIHVMRDGFAQDFEEFERELHCIAVPVFEHERLVAVIGVSGPAYRFKQQQMHEAIMMVKQELLHY